MRSSIDYATQAVRIANAGDGPVALPVSGGLDSRVVLALCLAAGLKDRLILYTHGAPDHPDVLSAQMVATRIGVPHSLITPDEKPAARGGVHPRRLWSWIRRSSRRRKEADRFIEEQAFAFLNDAMVSAWDLQIAKQSSRNVTMTGHMGEVLKHNGKKAAAGDTILDRVRQVVTIDKLGWLTPEALAVVENAIEAEIAPLAEGISADDIPDVFYYTQRIPNWLGAFSPTSTIATTFVRPLNSASLLKLAWQITQPERKSGLIHFQIVKVLAPGLLNIPFCRQNWDVSLAQYHPGLNTANALTLPKDSSGSSTPLHGSWQHQLNENEELLARLRDMCDAHPDSRLWSVLDRFRMNHHLRRGRFLMMGMIQLLGFLPLFMREHGHVPRKPIEIV